MKCTKTVKAGALLLATAMWATVAFAQAGNGGNNGGNYGGQNGNSAAGGGTMTGGAAGGNGAGYGGGNRGGGGAGYGAGQQGGNGGGAGYGAGQQGGNGGGAGAGMNSGANAGYLSGHFQARVPQYWIADAAIFVGNAVNTADVLTKEQSLNVQDPQIFASQGRFLRNSVGRAANDLQGLLNNAMQTQPAAVPAIRSALAELQAAEAQSTEFMNAADHGDLGPTYVVTIKSTLAHLGAANRQMGRVGGAYNAAQFTRNVAQGGALSAGK